VTLPVFKTGDRQLRCRWCVRLAHASANLFRSRAASLLRRTNPARLAGPAARQPTL